MRAARELFHRNGGAGGQRFGFEVFAIDVVEAIEIRNIVDCRQQNCQEGDVSFQGVFSVVVEWGAHTCTPELIREFRCAPPYSPPFPYFARGFGLAWNFTIFCRDPLPPSW